MKLIPALISGLVFVIGISVSGMMDPAKVLNFFDIGGTWDPSLAFFMAGPTTVTFLGYRVVAQRSKPLFSNHFQVPPSKIIDRRLVGGSAIFGIGWGIAGFCPGAAIPALGTGHREVILFLASVVAGFALRRVLAPTPKAVV